MDLIFTKTYPAVTNYKGQAKLEVDDFTIKKIVPDAFAVQKIIQSTETAATNENHTLLKTEVYWRQDSENNYFELFIYYLPAQQLAGGNISRMGSESTNHEMQSLQLPILLPYIVDILAIIAAVVITYMITAAWKRTVDAVCDPKDKKSCAEQLNKVMQPFEIGFGAIAILGAGVIYLAATGKRAREVI